MAKTRFEWDYEAAGDLMLRSEEIANVCEAQAEKMTRAAGVKYVADVHLGKTRVNARGVGSASEYKVEKKQKKVSGYYRRGKNGEMVWVNSYRRKK